MENRDSLHLMYTHWTRDITNVHLKYKTIAICAAVHLHDYVMRLK